ncbi:MAG: 2-dehydropantoate 2-reductase [Oscillospiraceae bacterium]|jgi:2-dehydropantoate 2-reductase
MIQTVSIVGLGALGTMFSHFFSQQLPLGNLRIVADAQRIKRYQSEGVYCNDESFPLTYLTPDIKDFADLVIFAVKFNGLEKAIQTARNQVGPQTVILSLLNGISSEEILGKEFGTEKVLYCTAQGMDALKVGNRMYYKNMGTLSVGDPYHRCGNRLQELTDFFDRIGFPYDCPVDMEKKLWGKLLLNTGINQAVTVYETNFGGVQKPGPARDTMIAAMREVIAIAQAEGIALDQTDLEFWLDLIDKLNPDGKPSMRQDAEAHRKTEVDLFSGTINALGKKHGIPTPVNQELYRKIKEIESTF